MTIPAKTMNDSSEDNDSSGDEDSRIKENIQPLWGRNGPNPPRFAQGPPAKNLPTQPMTYAQHVMCGVPQNSLTIDRAHLVRDETTFIYTQPVNQEVEMEDRRSESPSTLEDQEITICDEGLPVIDQWPRRHNMEGESIQVPGARDSAGDWSSTPMEDVQPAAGATIPNQGNCFIDNTLDWLKEKKARRNCKPAIKYDHQWLWAVRSSLYKTSQ